MPPLPGVGTYYFPVIEFEQDEKVVRPNWRPYVRVTRYQRGGTARYTATGEFIDVSYGERQSDTDPVVAFP